MTTSVNSRDVLTQQAIKPQDSTGVFKKILVAVDYVSYLSEVFEKALQLAKVNNSGLMIFHCLQGQIPGRREFPIYAAGLGAYSGVYSD